MKNLLDSQRYSKNNLLIDFLDPKLYWFCLSFHGLFLFPPPFGLWMTD